MKVNFSTVLTDVYGDPLQRQRADGVLSDMTAGSAAADALLAPNAEDKDGVRKVRLFTLALRVANGNEQDIEAEDIVLIKQCVANVYSPAVVGRMAELLKG